MNRLPMVAMLFACSVAVLAGSSATPSVFAPGVISDVGDNGAAAFTPDGATVYFMRSTGDGSTIFESHRNGSSWSKPQAAPFSGHWRDLDPSMAPDGSYLVFVSNRPAAGEGAPIDAVRGTRRTPGHGMNLWQVAREGDGWSKPVRLPDVVNSCSMSFAPSVAADGSLYYIGCAPDGSLHLKRAASSQGQYQAPQEVSLGNTDMQVRDPAVAPDQSFMVVSVARAPQQPYRLAIAFATAQGWSAPQDLGDAVNAGTHAMGGQLGPDHRTLYFYSDQHAPGENLPGDRIWQVSLAPWLDAYKPADLAQGPWQDKDASPAFAPDGNSVVFTRGAGSARRLYVAERIGAAWTPAAPAPYSQAWMDLEPAMAPDGSYLVFASSRPAQAGGAPLDGNFGGKSWPARGGNLWRIFRDAHGWGAPQRLPDEINDGNAIFSPAVAADGSLYFMKPDPAGGDFRLYVSRQKDGRYQRAQALSFSAANAGDCDPAVAPDQSFLVFASSRPPSPANQNELFIAFATPDGWSQPQPLGPLGTEPRLSPDLATLYYSGADHRLRRFSLEAWLREHHPSRS